MGIDEIGNGFVCRRGVGRGVVGLWIAAVVVMAGCGAGASSAPARSSGEGAPRAESGSNARAQEDDAGESSGPGAVEQGEDDRDATERAGAEPSARCSAALEATVPHARALHRESPSASPASVASIVATDFECVELGDAFDLDGDGTPDVAVARPGGAQSPGASAHYLFLETTDGLRYVGHVDAHPISPPACTRDRTNGLCDLLAGELMIHGEEDTHRYRYDGSRYQDAGVIHRSAPEPAP